MYVAGESVIDLALLRRIADHGGIETVGNRYPAGVNALMAAGFVKECAVGAGGYVCWKVTKRGLEALT